MCAPGVPGSISHGVPRSSSASSRALAVVTPIDSGVALGTESTHSSWMRVFYLLSRYFTQQLADSLVNRLAPEQARQVVAGARVFHDAEVGLQA